MKKGMTKEEFYDKWLGVSSKKEQAMKDLDKVIYTVAMEAIREAEKEIRI